MSAVGMTPQQQLAAVATPSASAAAVAAAAHAAAAANNNNIGSSIASGPSGASSAAAPGAGQGQFPALLPFAGFPGGGLPFPFFSLQQQSQMVAAAAAAQGQAGAASPNSAAKGGPNKKQKGASGAPITPQQHMAAGGPGAAAQPPANPYAFLGSYGLAAAAAAGGLPSFEGSAGMPRGRWTEDMTVRLIELRTKMDAKFRVVARPDRLWLEITTQICQEFQAHLPRQSTKDKWKNLRSSYRLINQNKHPSHYTKETWPFYHLLEQYMHVKAEHDAKNPNSAAATLNEPKLGMDAKMMGGMDSDDEGEDDGEEDESDDDGKGGKGKSGKKRGRASSGAAAAVAAAAQAAAASAYGASGSSGLNLHGQAAVAALGQLSPDLFALLKPKEVSRKERDWATLIRNMTSQLSTNIQESHQHMIGLTSHVREIAEKMAPSAAARRVKMETAASHAVRMAEVHMEVDVVRADLRHLPLLLPLFDQYRSFFAQASEPDRVEEFLRDKLAKQSSVIFVALPVHQSDKNLMMQGGGAHQGGQAGGDGSMSQQEQELANSLTTTHSVVAGAVQTNMAHGQGSRVAVRMPAYALGFVQVCPSWSSVRLARTWIISDLFVAPAARNKGVASLMLTHARKFASDTGAHSLDIHTSVHNTHMQRMFARLDFSKQLDNATFSHVL